MILNVPHSLYLNRFMLVVCVCVAMNGCTIFHRELPPNIYEEPPEGKSLYSANYVEGWQHGCQTGAAAAAKDRYQYSRLFQQNWQKVLDADYHTAWRRGFDYCRKNVLSTALGEKKE